MAAPYGLFGHLALSTETEEKISKLTRKAERDRRHIYISWGRKTRNKMTIYKTRPAEKKDPKSNIPPEVYPDLLVSNFKLSYLSILLILPSKLGSETATSSQDQGVKIGIYVLTVFNFVYCSIPISWGCVFVNIDVYVFV